MRRHFTLPLLVLLSTAVSLAEDVIHFVSAEYEPFRGEIVQFVEQGVVFKLPVTLSGGRSASTRENIPWRAIDYIEFNPLPNEQEAMSNPNSVTTDQLEELWKARSVHLERPRSSAGELGLLFAERLLQEESDFSKSRAMQLFKTIEEKAWEGSHQVRGRQGRLRGLIALGRVDEAMTEAMSMARESEDPLVLIESRYVQAIGEFNQMKEMEEEHPRWYDDDEVRPQRNKLFHKALDLFLHAYLFHGSEEESAARGLIGAAEVHAFAGDAPSARACLEDVVKLYANTSFLSVANNRLSELDQSQSSNEETTP